MDGARIAEGGEEVTDATVRARIRVDWRLARSVGAIGGQRPAMAVVRDGGIGPARSTRGPDLARVGGVESVADGRSGRERQRAAARARLNWFSQGQPWGTCKTARAGEPSGQGKKRRLRVPARPMRAVQRATIIASQAALAWPMLALLSAPRLGWHSAIWDCGELVRFRPR